MKHRVTTIVIFVCGLSLLPGCGRISDWAQDSFYQGETSVTDLTTPRNYLRSVIIYNQLETSAIFDALWLSQAVKTTYANILLLKQGKSEERAKAFLRRQLEENKHFISFYVLSSNNVELGDAQSIWSLFLDIDGHIIAPSSIKQVDLDATYQAFFGKRFNRFKLAYKVQFNAKDAEDNPVITPTTSSMTLFFKSFEKQAEFTWSIGQSDKMIVPEEQPQ